MGKPESMTDHALRFFEKRHDLRLSRDFPLTVGFPPYGTSHEFDLGIRTPDLRVIVTCDENRFLKNGNVPSNTLRRWQAHLYLFHLAPEAYKKIFFCRYDVRKRGEGEESLGEYFVTHFRHLIPAGVEIWEYEPVRGDVVRILTRLSRS